MVYALTIIYLYIASVFAAETYSEISSKNSAISYLHIFGISMALFWPAMLIASLLCAASVRFRQARWQMQLLSMTAMLTATAGATQLMYELV
jgi:hypothetical protein